MFKNYFLINLTLMVITAILVLKLHGQLNRSYEIPRLPGEDVQDIAGSESDRPAAPALNPADYAVIADRNLFHPSRSGEEKKAETPAALPLKEKPQVFGTTIMNNKRFALIENPATKKTALYRLNDTIAGFTVSEILREKVILARGGDTVEIGLREDKTFTPVKRPAPRRIEKKAKQRRRTTPSRRRMPRARQWAGQ